MPEPTSEQPAVPDVETVGGTLAHAVAEQLRQVTKYRRRVLAATDPEDLHQLRVAVRRLRAALRMGFEALDLDPTLRRGALADLSSMLGRLRDLDVVIAQVEAAYIAEPGVGAASPLAIVARRLRRRRQAARTRVRRALESLDLQQVLSRIRRWTRRPRLHPFGFRALRDSSPALMTPLLDAVKRHEAWTAPSPSPERLHDLRRRARAARYGLEATGSGRPADARTLKRMRDLQEALGALHDLDVTRETLSAALGRELHRRAPQFARQLAERRREVLATWEAISRS